MTSTMRVASCPKCNGQDLTFPASSKWNVERQCFEPVTMENITYCKTCETEVSAVWREYKVDVFKNK